ncbi:MULTISPECIES: peptide-methionine (S)-S-oxide reductase MsrA [Bacillus]|uniref:peptide-methionine (S)-S-oxide reductase MsrA n=1 Tax=Bacillus TaxID=1386 RepID=UPI000319AA98|nr:MULTISPECIES: peptide-methionine (S)-S-oxide reductase MsrA [Bacillus]
MEKIYFAGGCFWCMVKPFDSYEGIQSVVSGYMGGTVENPTYEQVKTGTTGHYEVVEIIYNEKQFSLKNILDIYWSQIDPTDPEGQFQDRGAQYRTAIFVTNESQKTAAKQSKKQMAESGRFKKEIVTEIIDAAIFYPAEDYHQDFYKKQPKHYQEDRKASGRDAFIEKYGSN